MEVAKVTSKGQITIPISIRRRLGINEGDKVLFVYKSDGVLMVNPDKVQGGYPADDADAAYALESGMADAPAAAAVTGSAASTGSVVKPAVEAPVIIGATVSEPATPTETPRTEARRPVPPPLDEPEEPEKQVGGLNLSSLLDDIRSIGSNI